MRFCDLAAKKRAEQRYVTAIHGDSNSETLVCELLLANERLEAVRLLRRFMLIILITLLFCVARNLVPEATRLLTGIETHAAILALSIFVVVFSRVWSVARARRLGQGRHRRGTRAEGF